MTTLGLDGNNNWFSLAYGVAPCENEEEWSFFIHAIVVDLDAIENSSNYTFMSDRHKASKCLLYNAPIEYWCRFFLVTDFFFSLKGIIKALKKIMPQAAKKIYVLHFNENFASNFPSKSTNFTFKCPFL